MKRERGRGGARCVPSSASWGPCLRRRQAEATGTSDSALWLSPLLTTWPDPPHTPLPSGGHLEEPQGLLTSPHTAWPLPRMEGRAQLWSRKGLHHSEARPLSIPRPPGVSRVPLQGNPRSTASRSNRRPGVKIELQTQGWACREGGAPRAPCSAEAKSSLPASQVTPPEA